MKYEPNDQEKLDIEQLYRRFKIVKNADNGMLLEDFTNFRGEVIFPKGTYKEEVEDYFNRVYPNGVNSLEKL